MLRIGSESGRGMASRGDKKWRRKEEEKGQTTEDKRTNASDGGRAVERVNKRMWVVLEERGSSRRVESSKDVSLRRTVSSE